MHRSVYLRGMDIGDAKRVVNIQSSFSRVLTFLVGRQFSIPQDSLTQHCFGKGGLKKCFKMLPILCLLTGCAAAIPALPALSGLMPAPVGTQVLTATTVNLSKQNYKITKANAVGSSMGFSFLGLISFKSPSYNEAITKLYQTAGVLEGKALALVNVIHERNSNYFILFALPEINVRADFIEFTGDAVSAPAETESAH